MDHHDTLDEALAAALGSAAPALREWGRQRGLTYQMDRLLTHGRSGALVCFVFETDTHAGGSCKLLLKLDNFPDGPLDESEFQRQRTALREAPQPFAGRHLTELAPDGHDLVRVGDGRWIVFQRIAGLAPQDIELRGGIDELDILTKALAAARAGGSVDATGRGLDAPVVCDPETFADVCAQVAGAVLRDWATRGRVARMDAATYLDRHLRGRLQAGKPLHTLSGRLHGATMRLPGHREALPNPFVVLAPDQPGGQRTISAVLGRCHGDLHTGNILVPVNNLKAPTAFRLVDLAKYQSEGPLARDPAGLMLYIVVRTLHDIDPDRRGALIEFIVDPDSGRGTLLPGWLQKLVRAIRDTGERFAHETGMLREWREQWLLSLVACALILLSRGTTPDAAKLWLLQLAGRAAGGFLGPTFTAAEHAGTTVTAGMVADLVERKTPQPGRTWVAAFCPYLPFMEARTQQRPEHRPELDRLLEAARTGTNRTDEFVEFVRVLGGPADNLRSPEDAEALNDVVYSCPMQLPCDRVAKPAGPQAGDPRCELRPGVMRREFW